MTKQMNWNAAKSEIVLSAEDYKRMQDSYLFRSEVENIRNKCADLENWAASADENNQNREKKSSVISIVGERGSGKSSVLRTCVNVLRDDGFFVFEPIDPNSLENSLKILEIVVAKIYTSLAAFSNKENNGVDEIRVAQICAKTKDLTKTLINLNVTKSVLNENLPAGEILTDIEGRLTYEKKLKECLAELIALLKSKKQMPVLCIDDVDLVDSHKVYQMLEDIRKYLATNIIVIVAYRDGQLGQAVLQRIVTSNQQLLKHGLISVEELREQSTKYLEKMMPFTDRVFLPAQDQLHKTDAESLLQILSQFDDVQDIYETYIEPYTKQGDEKDESGHYRLSFTQWFNRVVYAKTRLHIEPLDETEAVAALIPRNLRGVMDAVELFFYEMEDLHAAASKTRLEHATMLLDNISKFKEFAESHILVNLDVWGGQLIADWKSHPAESKNYFVYQNLFTKVLDINEAREYAQDRLSARLLNIYQVNSQNICMGDIYTILEEYKRFSNDQHAAIYLVYGLKLMYSMELLTLYLRAIKRSQEQNSVHHGNRPLQEYLLLLNAKIIPDNFHYHYRFNNNFNNNTFKYPKNIGEREHASINDQYQMLLNYICYTNATTNMEGNVRPYLPISQTTSSSQDPVVVEGNEYQYRSVFNYGYIRSGKCDYNLKAGKNYHFDPYTFVTKERYLAAAIDPDNVKKRFYIFYSLFDIDAFVRVVYDNHTKDGALAYVLRKVNYMVGAKRDSKYHFTDFRESVRDNIFDQELDVIAPYFDIEPLWSLALSDKVKRIESLDQLRDLEELLLPTIDSKKNSINPLKVGKADFLKIVKQINGRKENIKEHLEVTEKETFRRLMDAIMAEYNRINNKQGLQVKQEVKRNLNTLVEEFGLEIDADINGNVK